MTDMRILRHTYMMLLAVLTMVMAACSSDDGDIVADGGGTATVTLRVGTATTRAAWQDGSAADDEMMNVWTVVVARGGSAVKVLACKPTADYREVDPVETRLELGVGTYTFYTFANMAPGKVAELLGLTFAVPELAADGTVAVVDNVGGTVQAERAVTIPGNGFDPTAVDNGFGSQGIPMSNCQTVNVNGDMTKDLIAVRMLAKMTIEITNATGKDVTLNSAVLAGVTANAENNLMLMPRHVIAGGEDSMEPLHGGIQPNLNGTPATVDYELPVGEDPVIANGAKKTLTFYVNESTAPESGRFTLTLQLDDAEYRYSIIDDSNEAADDDGRWDYIARNDYRTIPVALDDYTLELIPYDFPAIGVLPASVREVDAVNHIYEMTFHDYGHFHLVPMVTRSGGTPVPYGGTGTHWMLPARGWADAWFTSTAFGAEAVAGGNPGGFYAVEELPSTADAPDNGGIPVLDTGTTWNGFSPFIFGKIAEPAADEALPRKAYHEFRARLYVDNGSVAYSREMLYRFNMVLSPM